MMSVVLATSVLLALPVQDDTVSQAQALLAEGNPDAALAALEGAGDSPDVCIARGKAYMAQADAVFNATGGGDDVTNLLQDGRAQFEKAVELAPDEVNPLKELGYVRLYRFGESDAVMDMATQGLEAHPGDGELLLLRGCAGAYVYWNAKQSGDETASQNAWDAAVKDLDESTKVLPRERVEPWGQLLWFYEDAAQGEKAVDAAIAIVDREDDPNYDNLYRLAVNYSYSRDFAASGKALEKIISLSARELTNRLKKSERMDEVATNLAWSIDPFVQRQDRATARAILQAIVSADPKAPDVWHNYAVMCEETSRFEDAKKAYEKLIEIDANNPRAYNDLGALLHHQLNRDLDRAKELYQKCIDMANEQLSEDKLTPDRRAFLTTARSVAQGSLDQLAPAEDSGGLLEGLLDGLSGLDLPELPEDEEGDGEGDGSGG